MIRSPDLRPKKGYFLPWPDTARAVRRRFGFALIVLAMLAVPANLINHPWSPFHKDQPWQVRMFAAFGVISAVQGAMPWIVGARLGRRLALRVTQR
jgi:hypothetical protein